MKLRKELKIKARKNFKRHYLLFILVCLIGAFIGAEYKNSLFITKSVNNNVINDVKDKQFNKAKILVKYIESYFKDNGGKC